MDPKKEVTFDLEDPEDLSDSSTTTTPTFGQLPPRSVQEQQKVHTYLAIFLILILGSAAAAAFLSITGINAKQERQGHFERQATELVNRIETTWNDYEYAGLWIHEACRYHNITRQEFRELYEYIKSGGLEFQAAEFIPNVTHDLRDEYEAASRAYYAENYPDINYRGFVGFEPVSPGSSELSIQPRSEQPFYFIVHYVEPVEANAAAIDLDLYSSSKRRATIESALETWKPALTDRLRLVQERDESAYSVLLMHPGIPLESSPSTKARDLSLMVIRIPSLLTRATQKQGERLAVYLYDSTRATEEDAPQFLGGIKVHAKQGEAERSTEFVDEIELDELLGRKTPVDVYRQEIFIASSRWEAVVVPLEGTFESTFDMEILGGILIFVGTLSLAFWMYANMRRNSKIYEMQVQAEAERNIVRSLFPSNVRDRLLQDAAAHSGKHGGDSGKGPSSSKNISSLPGELSSETIFGSKPIADFFTEVTIMFADLAGFTAWSSAREPAQVFALLEVIYHSFDVMAKKRGVFKLETVGDCYVAVCGVPDPKKDHAEVMAKFATSCLIKLHQLTTSLEISMGPDTADLDIRIGLHSGPVTAGVLRGDKGRFQLFGDTMNTAERIQSTGHRSKIHVSSETADLLRRAEKDDWLTERKDSVYAKGKGVLKTYWLNITNDATAMKAPQELVANPRSNGALVSTASAKVDALKEENHNKRMERLIDWSVEVFSRLLKLVVAKRNLQGKSSESSRALHFRAPSHEKGLLDEVRDVVTMPDFDSSADFERLMDPNQIKLDPEVENELREYISVIAELYHRNSFHNFEHAGHVLMSVCKLFTRIVTPRSAQTECIDSREKFAAVMHDNTFGIASDPLTRFACAFSALIHDVDHPGVPNSTLVSEKAIMAATYFETSVAEQNSIDIAWDLLMTDRYEKLVKCLCGTKHELSRFRQLVVNMVMATDVMDKNIGARRKARWEKAFSEQRVLGDPKENVNRKATIVIEHLIQASDVSHTMQHWHVYRKWNERLFCEMYKAYKAGRLPFNPAEKWYEGEISFFDYYIIPLAKKLDTCGVFGVSSDELLNYAEANRKEWEDKGKDLVELYLKTFDERES